MRGSKKRRNFALAFGMKDAPPREAAALPPPGTEPRRQAENIERFTIERKDESSTRKRETISVIPDKTRDYGLQFKSSSELSAPVATRTAGHGATGRRPPIGGA